jgi:hypothetical protein
MVTIVNVEQDHVPQCPTMLKFCMLNTLAKFTII